MAAYVSGYSNTMDVARFGFNTQSAMFWQSQHAQLDVHNGVTCDSCGANPLRGIRWKCQSCPDHDICNNCKKTGRSGHLFQITSKTTTNNQIAAAQGLPQTPEAGVHWTTCQGCNAKPIRGTLYSCTQCPNFDLCQQCNTQRCLAGNHLHRFDFFYMPRESNPPSQAINTNAGGTQQHDTQPRRQNGFIYGSYAQGHNASYWRGEHDNTYRYHSSYDAERKRDKISRLMKWLGEQHQDSD